MDELTKFHKIWGCVTYVMWESKNQLSSFIESAAVHYAWKCHPTFLNIAHLGILWMNWPNFPRFRFVWPIKGRIPKIRWVHLGAQLLCTVHGNVTPFFWILHILEFYEWTYKVLKHLDLGDILHVGFQKSGEFSHGISCCALYMDIW
jgi:hypothetical protein